MSDRQRATILVLRVWDEEGLRARMVAFEDVRSHAEISVPPGAQRSVAASTVDDICRMVRGWLEPQARESGETPPTGAKR
jgi:hypothetical protein